MDIEVIRGVVRLSAALTALGQADLVHRVLDQHQSISQVAEALGVSCNTVRKWVARFKAEGVDGLRDRSSRPQHLFQPTDETVISTLIALRRRRWTGKRIAEVVGVSTATVSRPLRRHGLSRFDVSVKFVNDMVKLKRETGALSPKRQGNPGIGKQTPHEERVRSQVVVKGEITLDEMASRLEAERGIRVVPGSVWRLFKRLGLTHKKTFRRLNRSVRKSPISGASGLSTLP